MSLTPEIILKAAILEEALKVYKVAAYHELKFEHLQECEKMPETNSKERYLKQKANKDTLPHPIRLEKAVSWVHWDKRNYTDSKIVEF